MLTSFDLSHVGALRSLGAVARAIDDATSGINGRWLIVGATARDLILTFVHQLPEGRKTVDLDIAVAIESWQTFAVLEKQLINLGGQRDPSMAHRFRLQGWRIDIVPFGGVEQDGFTRQLMDSGKTLGVEVLDHLVVATAGFVSFKQRGWM